MKFTDAQILQFLTDSYAMEIDEAEGFVADLHDYYFVRSIIESGVSLKDIPTEL